jgi:hypothetical protein
LGNYNSKKILLVWKFNAIVRDVPFSIILRSRRSSAALIKRLSHRGNFHPVRKNIALKPSGTLNEQDLQKRAALHAKLIRRAGGRHST